MAIVGVNSMGPADHMTPPQPPVPHKGIIIPTCSLPIKSKPALLPPCPDLDDQLQHVPHLVYLQVMSTKDIFMPPTAGFYEQVASILTSFTELSAFELSEVH
ncbi:hypothetical protein DFH29DRAFT_872819 [Suillus ampliporus]|nr:hypothetical protein DFH29DRAFT_872819 [Suillus ampliporus]